LFDIIQNHDVPNNVAELAPLFAEDSEVPRFNVNDLDETYGDPYWIRYGESQQSSDDHNSFILPLRG
jgi:hypothetical protein